METSQTWVLSRSLLGSPQLSPLVTVHMVTTGLPQLQTSHRYPLVSKGIERTQFSHALLDRGLSFSRSPLMTPGQELGQPSCKGGWMHVFFTFSCCGGRWALPSGKRTEDGARNDKKSTPRAHLHRAILWIHINMLGKEQSSWNWISECGVVTLSPQDGVAGKLFFMKSFHRALPSEAVGTQSGTPAGGILVHSSPFFSKKVFKLKWNFPPINVSQSSSLEAASITSSLLSSEKYSSNWQAHTHGYHTVMPQCVNFNHNGS